MNGHIHPVKIAFSHFMRRWYEQLFADTTAVDEFAARGLEKSIIWVSGRMVDAAEDMLAAYQRNENAGDAGHKSKLPVVLVGMAKDYTPTTGDRGKQSGDRRMVKIADDAPGDPASVYGYTQAMGDIRTQVVIAGPDEPSARSLAVQFGKWVGAIANRRFYATFAWGQYEVQMPIMLETPDIAFMDIQSDRKNLTMLAADLNLTATFPYFDAPKDGQPNDGSAHNPPGYPVVLEVAHTERAIPLSEVIVTKAGVTRG